MGYRERTLTLRFDGNSDLPDLGDDVIVTIRNPQLLSLEKLQPRDVPLKEDGTPVNNADATMATYEMIAKLITSWNVFDAEDDSEDPPPLGDVTVENVAKLPMAILTAITDKLNPNP